MCTLIFYRYPSEALKPQDHITASTGVRIQTQVYLISEFINLGFHISSVLLEGTFFHPSLIFPTAQIKEMKQPV